MVNPSPDVPPESEAVTQFRASIARGETLPAGEMLPLVYNELHNLARARLARESPGQTLQPTALVHEAYLRLVGSGPDVAWEGRGHFFAAAAEAMRRILVEKARRARRRRHAGGLVRVDLDQVPAPPPPTRSAERNAGRPPRDSRRARRRAADRRRAGQVEVLRGPDHRARRPDPGRLAPDRQSALGVRPGVALRAPQLRGQRPGLKKIRSSWHISRRHVALASETRTRDGFGPNVGGDV